MIFVLPHGYAVRSRFDTPFIADSPALLLAPAALADEANAEPETTEQATVAAEQTTVAAEGTTVEDAVAEGTVVRPAPGECSGTQQQLGPNAGFYSDRSIFTPELRDFVKIETVSGREIVVSFDASCANESVFAVLYLGEAQERVEGDYSPEYETLQSHAVSADGTMVINIADFFQRNDGTIFYEFEAGDYMLGFQDGGNQSVVGWIEFGVDGSGNVVIGGSTDAGDKPESSDEENADDTGAKSEDDSNSETESAPTAPKEEELNADIAGSVSVTEVTAEEITLFVGSDLAGETVYATLFSTPVSLGSGVVDNKGSVSFAVPAGIEAGAHKIALQVANGALIGWASLTIESTDDSTDDDTFIGVERNIGEHNNTQTIANETTATKELAATGAENINLLLSMATVLLLAGGAAFLTRRIKTIS